MTSFKHLLINAVPTVMLLLTAWTAHAEVHCCFSYDEIKKRHLRVYTDIYAALRNPSQVDILKLNHDPFVYNPELYTRLKEFTNLKCICGSLNREHANELLDGLQECKELVSLPYINWKNPPEFVAGFKKLRRIEIYYANNRPLWDNHYHEFINLTGVRFFGNSIPSWLNNYPDLKGFTWTFDTNKIVLPSVLDADDLSFRVIAKNDVKIEINEAFGVKKLNVRAVGSVTVVGNGLGPIKGPLRLVISTDKGVNGSLQFGRLIGTESVLVVCKESSIPMAELLLVPDLCDLEVPDFLLNEYFENSDVSFHCPCGKLNCNLWVRTDTLPKIYKDFEFNYRTGPHESEPYKDFSSLNQTERLFLLTANVKSISNIVSSVRVADSLSLYFESSSYDLTNTRELRKLRSLKSLYSLDFVFYIDDGNEKYKRRVSREIRFLKRKLPKTNIYYEFR